MSGFRGERGFRDERELARSDRANRPDVIRGNDVPAPYRPPAEGGPILPAGTLDLGDGVTKDAAWQQLGAKVRQRLIDLTGTTLEWWAFADPPARAGKPSAFVLGDRGFASAEPVRDQTGRWVYRVNSAALAVDSFRYAEVTGSGPGDAPAPQAGAGRSGAPAPVLRGINRQLQGVIGSMPRKAQRLVLEPFLKGEEARHAHTYYEGTPDELHFFAVLLLGPRTLTMATGSRYTPLGLPESRSNWSLFCRRASVVRRGER